MTHDDILVFLRTYISSDQIPGVAYEEHHCRTTIMVMIIKMTTLWRLVTSLTGGIEMIFPARQVILPAGVEALKCATVNVLLKKGETTAL